MKIDKNLSGKLRIMSGLGIVMIVFLHSRNSTLDNEMLSLPACANAFTQDFLSKWVLRSGLPTMSIISGFLFFSAKMSPTPMLLFQKFRNRVKSVALPFLLWSTLTLALSLAIKFLQVRDLSIVENWTPLFLWENIVVSPANHPLYFLRDLIVIMAFGPILLFALRRPVSALAAMAGLFVLWWLRIHPFHVNMRILFFFYVGAFFAMHAGTPQLERIRAFFQRNSVLVPLAIAWLALCAVGAWLAQEHTYASMTLGNTSKLLGVVFLWFAYNRISSTSKFYQLLDRISKFNFIVFVLHFPFVLIFKGIIRSSGLSNPGLLFTSFLATMCCSIALCIVIGKLMKKTVPAFYSFSVGGRDVRAASRAAAHSASSIPQSDDQPSIRKLAS